MKGYAYASGDLISSPNTYFYTQFEGFKFFDDWKDSRRQVLVGKCASQHHVKSGIALLPYALQEKLKLGEAVDTLCILDSSYEWMKNRNERDESGLGLINLLVKRFELTKKIYGSYFGQMRPFDKEKFNDLTLYVRAAEVFEAAYDLFGSIQYLNVLIKVIDTLCSVSGRLNEADRGRLYLLITKEKKHICLLAGSVGVVL